MAGTVAVYSDRMYGEAREIYISCTGDASDGTIPDTDLCDLDGYTYGPLGGWGLWAFETIPGTTGPTDDTDMYLKTENGSDLLEAEGVNAIDNATVNLVVLDKIIFIGSTLTLDVNNQAVNSAGYKIKLCLVR